MAIRLLSLAIMIAAWYLGSRLAGPRLFPDPQTVALAIVDEARSGALAFNLGVTLARGTDSDAFSTAAAKLAPVTEVLHLTGAPDYQLRVSCRDTAELDALLRTLRLRLGASDTETTIVLRSGPAR